MSPVVVPAGVADLVEFQPIEDVMIALLRADLPSVPVYTRIPPNPPMPFMLTRRVSRSMGRFDERFLDTARVFVNVFTDGRDAEDEAGLISEAVRVIMSRAWRTNRTLDGLGTIKHTEIVWGPYNVTDWSTSSGPVQFADLPSGYRRYESLYDIEVRKPR